MFYSERQAGTITVSDIEMMLVLYCEPPTYSSNLVQLVISQMGFCRSTCFHAWGEEKGAVAAEGVYVGED